MRRARATASSPKSRAIGAALLGLAIAFTALLYAFDAHNPGRDPDRWYHYALSRATAQQGLVRTLPQADDLGWGRRFVDKEFLFHQLTALGYRAGGDSGVNAVAHLIAFALIAALFMIAARDLPAPAALALVAVGACLSPYFSARLVQIRPHLLAIACATALAWSCVRAWPWAAFAAACAFAESYHAFFIPVLVVGVAATRPRLRRAAGFGAAGLVAGLVLNPYFPGNVELGLVHLKIAVLRSSFERAMEAGGELAPLPIVTALSWFGGQWLALGACALAWRKQGPRWPAREQVLVFGLLAAGFWTATLRSARACEYAVPFTLIAAAPALKTLVRPRRGAPFALLLASAAALACPAVLELKGLVDPTHPIDNTYRALTESLLAAATAIPPAPRALERKVLNCDWGSGAFLLYARPDVRFVDLLDPRLLEEADPAKYEALRDFKTGQRDPYDVARGVFGADDVFCLRPDVNERLARDPRFKRIYVDPPRQFGRVRYSSPIAVFEIMEISEHPEPGRKTGR